MSIVRLVLGLVLLLVVVLLVREEVMSIVGLVLGLVLLLVVVLLVRALKGSNLPRIASVVSLGTIVLTVVITLWVTLTTLLADQLDVTVPTRRLPVRLADGLTLDPPPPATIMSGGFDQVSVAAEGIGMTARIAFATGYVLTGATVVGVAWVVWRLARSLGEQDPFRLGRRALHTVAIIVVVGGLLASIAGDIGNAAASHDLFAVSDWSLVTTGTPPQFLTELGWPEPAGFRLTIPFWPLAAGLVLELLAAVFSYGAQLRRDTEGLI